LDWYRTIFELIDLRSFSNLWFWIAVAVLWSSASHWVLGVPYDMVLRARRHGGEAQADLEMMVGVNVRRLLYIGRTAGLWLTGLTAFLLTGLALLGFAYNIEFAQAVLLLVFPMTFVGALSLSTARRIEAAEPTGPELWRQLTRHRMGVQMIGVVSIFVTALWGMWKNITAAVI
jgi:hypothetical protein